MTNLPHSQEDVSSSSAPTSQSLEEMFGEPISIYTDAEAIEDGFIVDLAKFTNVRFLGLPINRMTRYLYDDLEPFAKSAAEMLYDGNLASAFGCLFATNIRFANGDPGNRGEAGDLHHSPEAVARPQRSRWLDRHVPGRLLTGSQKARAGGKPPALFSFARSKLGSGRLYL